MAFTVPVSKNYSSPLNAVPLDWSDPPREGNKGIQCSIQWNAAGGGPNKSVYLNMADNAPLNFSKIRAIVVDNSLNGSDVRVTSPDTETTFTIPAYTPYAVIPVFTNATSFYIQSPNALDSDITSFMILNTLPPPIAVPTTQEQNIAAVGSIDVSAASGSATLIASTINGTLETVDLRFGYAAGVSPTFTWQIMDGNNVVVAQGRGVAVASNTGFVPLLELADVRVRFSKGLTFTWTGTNLNAAFAIANLYYRTP